MLERFTDEARAAVMRAGNEASAPRKRLVDTEHLLLALLDEHAGGAYTVLHDAGLTADQVRADIDRLVAAPDQILSEDDAAALRTIGIDVSAVLARIEESFGLGALDDSAGSGSGGSGSEATGQGTATARRGFRGRRSGPGRGPSQGRSRFTERGRKVLELSLREAVRLHHDQIGTEHLLLALIRERDGLAMKIVAEAGVSPDDLRTAALSALGVSG